MRAPRDRHYLAAAMILCHRRHTPTLRYFLLPSMVSARLRRSARGRHAATSFFTGFAHGRQDVEMMPHHFHAPRSGDRSILPASFRPLRHGGTSGSIDFFTGRSSRSCLTPRRQRGISRIAVEATNDVYVLVCRKRSCLINIRHLFRAAGLDA